MRSVLAAVGIALAMTMLALQATPSSAQKREETKQNEAEQQAAQRAKDRKATDNQYKSAIERLPDQKFDPWRNMR
jgi:type II secretory pathway pseudopilin PulG